MFLHLFRYKLKDLLHSRQELFWCSLFPIILATLFFFGFGNLMNGNDIQFSPIPVAVVTENTNEAFISVLDSLSTESPDQMFETVWTDAGSAQQLLNDGKAAGIIYVKDRPSLAVKEAGLSQTILESFIDQYLANVQIIEDIVTSHPEQLQNAVEILTGDSAYLREQPSANVDFDPYVQYFYALIAMACLYASMTGVRCAANMQANMSDLGIRRETAPTHKLVTIIADFCATVTLQFIYFLLLMAYLIFILQIHFGSRTPFVLLTGLAGIIIGTALGLFIGSAVKKPLSVKMSLASGSTITMCFLSGLMLGNMKDIIEHSCPVINRINPAALITDSLYALNMYEDFSRYTQNMLVMLAMAVLLCIGSYLFLRRNTYANL